MKVTTMIEDVLIGCGIMLSLVDIQQWFSIALLVLDVVWILAKMGFKLYTHIKNKKIEDAIQDVKDAHDELQVIDDALKTKETKKIDSKKGE